MTDSLEAGDRVEAEPVVGPAEGGVMHEVIRGTVDELHPEGEAPFPGESVVMVDPDGDDPIRPVRESNVTRLEEP